MSLASGVIFLAYLVYMAVTYSLSPSVALTYPVAARSRPIGKGVVSVGTRILMQLGLFVVIWPILIVLASIFILLIADRADANPVPGLVDVASLCGENESADVLGPMTDRRFIMGSQPVGGMSPEQIQPDACRPVVAWLTERGTSGIGESPR